MKEIEGSAKEKVSFKGKYALFYLNKTGSALDMGKKGVFIDDLDIKTVKLNDSEYKFIKDETETGFNKTDVNIEKEKLISELKKEFEEKYLSENEKKKIDKKDEEVEVNFQEPSSLTLSEDTPDSEHNIENKDNKLKDAESEKNREEKPEKKVEEIILDGKKENKDGKGEKDLENGDSVVNRGNELIALEEEVSGGQTELKDLGEAPKLEGEDASLHKDLVSLLTGNGIGKDLDVKYLLDICERALVARDHLKKAVKNFAENNFGKKSLNKSKILQQDNILGGILGAIGGNISGNNAQGLLQLLIKNINPENLNKLLGQEVGKDEGKTESSQQDLKNLLQILSKNEVQKDLPNVSGQLNGGSSQEIINGLLNFALQDGQSKNNDLLSAIEKAKNSAQEILKEKSSSKKAKTCSLVSCITAGGTVGVSLLISLAPSILNYGPKFLEFFTQSNNSTSLQ